MVLPTPTPPYSFPDEIVTAFRRGLKNAGRDRRASTTSISDLQNQQRMQHLLMPYDSLPPSYPDLNNFYGLEPAYCQEFNPLDPQIEEEGMSLVIAAKAKDGVVLVADRRRALLGSRGAYNDRAVKLMELPGDVLVGFAGFGQWAESLLQQHGASIPSGGNAVDAARAVLSLLEPRFPDVTFFFASAKPDPRIVYLARARIGNQPNWVIPVEAEEPYLIAGISEEVADLLLPHVLSEETPVEQAAAYLLAIHHATAEINCFVSPTWDMLVKRSSGAPWTDEDSELADLRANEILEALHRNHFAVSDDG